MKSQTGNRKLEIGNLKLCRRSRSISNKQMELDKNAQDSVRQLGAAINKAIEKSTDVTRAIDGLRALGYEPNLTLKLEIALQEIGEHPAEILEIDRDIEDIELELTDEDLRTLRRMKIRIE